MEGRVFSVLVSSIILLSALGCGSTEQVFVARTDVPNEPTLTVIPANNSLYQVHFANEVEEKVIEAGLVVLDRPTLKEKEVSQEAELAQTVGSEQASQKTAEITQTYMEYGESEADYVIRTHAGSEEVRVIEQASNKVLASFDLIRERTTTSATPQPETPLRDALREIGLPVIEEKEE